MPSWLCRGDQFFDTIPLTVAEIAWIQLVFLHLPSVSRLPSLFKQALRHRIPKGVSAMSTEDNKALVRRFYDEVTNGRNVAVLDELLAPNFEGFKVEGLDRGQNRGEFKQMLTTMLNAFPDHQQTIHDWIAEDDKVVTRWTAQGTHL